MPIETPDHPNWSHYKFPYAFSDNDEAAPDGGGKQGINFGNIWKYGANGDLLIYYNTTDLSGENPNYIECWCSRWDVQDYSVIIETWIKKESVEILRNSIKPGAVGELYNILGVPRYYDKTWTKANTLVFYPLQYTKKVKYEDWSEGDEFTKSNLKFMRDKRIVYIKNLSEHPIKGNSGLIEIKLEGYISGNSL